jgi:signal transduction histidine kinase
MAIRERANGAASPNRSLGNETTLAIMMRPLIYLGYYLALAAVAFRGLNTLFSEDYEGRWAAAGLLLAFFILSVGCYWLARRVRWYPHLYMTLQGSLALGLLLLPPHLDYFSILFFLLSAQAMLLFPQRVGYLWLGLLTAAMAGTLLGTNGWQEALPLTLLYGAGFYFFGSFATLTAQSVAARAELQKAHSQLREYAVQAEELAVTQERNRLARDLHDSVT